MPKTVSLGVAAFIQMYVKEVSFLFSDKLTIITIVMDNFGSYIHQEKSIADS